MTDESSVQLEDMTWTDVETALEDGIRTAVVPVGSIEQHGPHLPLKMDTLAGEAVCERIAEKLGDALAGPAIQPGCSAHHMEFPGTITISPETLMDTIESYCRSLDDHGFECIALVPTHGGNFGPVNTVAPEVARDIDATVVALADLEENMALMNEGMAEAGVEYQEPSIHAGAAETAVVLAVEPDLVRTDRLEPGAEGKISGARMINEGFDAVTENGVLGDPREGTAEAGEAIIERMATAYAEQIEAERDID